MSTTDILIIIAFALGVALVRATDAMFVPDADSKREAASWRAHKAACFDELLAALKQALECLAGDCDDYVAELRIAMRAAIAKAEGRS